MGEDADEGSEAGQKFLGEVQRVLKQKGVYLCISLLQSHVLSKSTRTRFLALASLYPPLCCPFAESLSIHFESSNKAAEVEGTRMMQAEHFFPLLAVRSSKMCQNVHPSVLFAPECLLGLCTQKRRCAELILSELSRDFQLDFKAVPPSPDMARAALQPMFVSAKRRKLDGSYVEITSTIQATSKAPNDAQLKDICRVSSSKTAYHLPCRKNAFLAGVVL